MREAAKIPLLAFLLQLIQILLSLPIV
jgi:hypothetical protein